jgi:CRISPR system Cascade subunit CasB
MKEVTMAGIMTEKKSKIDLFLEYLGKHLEDRGMMADLRAGLSEGTAYRAWPYIGPWCDLADDRERTIWMTVGAGFAVHKENNPEAGNMGSTLRKIALGDGTQKPNDALASLDSRFRRLLTCSSAEEVCERLTGIIRTAERKGVGIDFRQLFWDLAGWNSANRDVRVDWASAYWSAPDEEGGDDR